MRAKGKGLVGDKAFAAYTFSYASLGLGIEDGIFVEPLFSTCVSEPAIQRFQVSSVVAACATSASA